MASIAVFALIGCNDEPVPEPVEPAISASEQTLSFAGDGASKEFNLSATGDWISDAEGGWLKIDPAIGKGDAKVNVTALANPAKEARYSKIVFSLKENKSVSCTVSIVQAGAGQEDPGPDGPELPDNSSVKIPKS